MKIFDSLLVIIVLVTFNYGNSISILKNSKTNLEAKKNEIKRKCSDSLRAGYSDLIKRETHDSRNNFYIADLKAPFNEDGDVNSLRIYAETLLPLQLVIYRKEGGWSVVGKSELFTPTQLGLNEFFLAEPITVKKGDIPGFYQPEGGSISVDKDLSNYRAWEVFDFYGGIFMTNIGGEATDWYSSSDRIYSYEVSGKCGTKPECLEFKVGTEVIERDFQDSDIDTYLVDTNLSFESDGKVNSFKFWAMSSSPVQLFIVRKNDDIWTVVGESQVVNPEEGLNEIQLTEPISVKSGDFVGIHHPGGGNVSYSLDGDNWTTGDLSGHLLISNGEPTKFWASSERTYSIEVSGKSC